MLTIDKNNAVDKNNEVVCIKSLYLKNSELIELQLIKVMNERNIIFSAMRYSLLQRGKRFRPHLVIAASMLNSSNIKTAVFIGCAIELIHCFSLIHDDLPSMDNDKWRRNTLSNHIMYGDAIALLAGDALHALCFELLSSTEYISDKNKLNIINVIAKAIGPNGMVFGQALELKNTDKNLENCIIIHQLKTGALIKASVLSGYLIDNKEENALPALENIADKIGILFQILDDISDHNIDNNHSYTNFVKLVGLEEASATANIMYNEIIELINTNISINSEYLLYLVEQIYSRCN